MLTANDLYELIYQEAVEVSCEHFKNKADFVEVEKVAEILADVTGASPCDMVGNEWLVSCCEYVEHCCQKNDGECWMQYLKHCKERSEGDG